MGRRRLPGWERSPLASSSRGAALRGCWILLLLPAAAAPQPVRVEVWAESLRVERALALPTLPRVRIQIRPIEPRTTFRWRSG